MSENQFAKTLWRIYNRPDRPIPFSYGGNLPWDDPAFSKRMLEWHLKQDSAAATRVSAEIDLQVEYLTKNLNLQPNQQLLDITCGPGLYATRFAQQGLSVTGIDFGPASIDYANDLKVKEGVAEHCEFLLQDVREMRVSAETYDAAILIYGQIAVMTKAEATHVLTLAQQALKPGGTLFLEWLNQARVDKQNSTWWFTQESGSIWGDTPFLNLGERLWYEDEQLSLERYHTVSLETGKLDEVVLCDQTYSQPDMTEMLSAAGFSTVTHHDNWHNLPLYDAKEWIVTFAKK